MSFLKKLFDKITSDDDKYGKGHRLGNKEEEERRRRERERAAAEVANRPKTSAQLRQHGNTEAAQAAGQAALARIQQQQQPKVVKPTANSSLQRQTSSQLEESGKRLEEAQRVKEHYFGASHQQQFEASQHIKVQVSFKCPDLLGDDVSLPRTELEERILDKLLENLNEEPVLTALTLLFTANYRDDEKLQRCLDTLNKIIENIIANPSEEKYRKIRCENPSLKEKILSCKYSELVLTVIGFKLLKLKKQQTAETDTEELEDFYVFDHEDARNYEKLTELKEGVKIVQPIKPVLDRKTELYQITSAATQNDANCFNLSNDFYNLNINELKNEQKLRQEALDKAGVLRTKAMRERDEVLALRKYNYCLIRVKFSDLIYLQMIFKSTETLKDLYCSVQECLRDESMSFDLSNYVLKAQQQNLNQTFAEYGLAPAAVLHFRSSVAASIGLDLFKQHLHFNLRNTFA